MSVRVAIATFLIEAVRELLHIIAWDLDRPLRRRDVALVA